MPSWRSPFQHVLDGFPPSEADLPPVLTEDEVAITLISAFYASTFDGARLTQHASYQSYKRVLDRAWRTIGHSKLRFTPHSARAGWATEMRLRGMAISELKQQGRWSSDKSLACYLDVTATRLLEQPTGSLRQSGLWLLGDVPGRFPWWR